MSGAALLLGFVLVLAGVSLIFRARHGAAVVLEVWRRPTTRIAAIAPGVVELAGTIAPSEEPVAGLSKQDCVAVRTRVSGYKRQGNQRQALGERSTLRVTRALLRDATGGCALDLEDAEILGEEWTAHHAPVEAIAKDLPPWARDLIPPGATHVEIHEMVVPAGAEVMVTAVTKKQEKAEGFYRDAKARWDLGGTEERRLLLTVGGQRQLFARTGGATAAAVLFGVWACVQGIATMVAAVGL